MTSYSVYRAADPDDPDDVREANIDTFIAGAARAVLDETEVRGDDESDDTEPKYAEAVWWHSPEIGWEVDAIDPEDRARFVERVTAFIGEHHDGLAAIAAAIAADRHDFLGYLGGGWYRAGMLFTYSTLGSGVGLWEYDPDRFDGPVSRAARDFGELRAWIPDSDDAPHVQFESI